MTRFNPVRLLHAETPLRVWSLIVTIFGDAVMDRGRIRMPEPLWTADLMALLDLLGIDAGQVRTNLSRLAANGTLVRERSGRNTSYRPSPQSAADFAAAAGLIYGARRPVASGMFDLALLDFCDSRAAARERLAKVGFRFLSTALAIRPRHEGTDEKSEPSDVVFAVCAPAPTLNQAVQALWHIDELHSGYRRFVAAFAAMGEIGSAEEAVLIRMVAVHLFRRLIWRDPFLPSEALPKDWQGQRARDVFDATMATVREASETWLAAHGFRKAISWSVAHNDNVQRNM